MLRPSPAGCWPRCATSGRLAPAGRPCARARRRASPGSRPPRGWMQSIAGCCSRLEEEFMASTAPPESGLESAAHPTIEQLTALARDRRSIRGFQRDRDVPEALIRQIIEVARWAPSGGNGQPWEFVVVRDGTIRMTGAGFRDAPVHIVVVGDPRVNESYPVRTREDKGERHFITGLANATLLLHLAATSLGLASQYVSDAGSPYM